MLSKYTPKDCYFGDFAHWADPFCGIKQRINLDKKQDETGWYSIISLP